MDIFVNVNNNHVLQALSGAFDSGGIRYWATVDKYMRVEGPKRAPWNATENYLERLLKRGHAIHLVHEGKNGPEATPHPLAEDTIRAGLALMATQYPTPFAQLMAGAADANVGDLLVQLACFGQLVYG